MTVYRYMLAVKLLLSVAISNHAYVRVQNLTCAYNKLICATSHCYLSSSRGKNYYVNADCDMMKVMSNLWLEMRLLRKVNNNYMPHLFEVQQNLCNMKSSSTDNYFFKRLITMGLKNLKNVKCPMQGKLKIEKMPCMLYLFQGIVPPSEYLVRARIYNNNTDLVAANLTFVVT